jgi:hypothetical protein
VTTSTTTSTRFVILACCLLTPSCKTRSRRAFDKISRTHAKARRLRLSQDGVSKQHKVWREKDECRSRTRSHC